MTLLSFFARAFDFLIKCGFTLLSHEVWSYPWEWIFCSSFARDLDLLMKCDFTPLSYKVWSCSWKSNFPTWLGLHLIARLVGIWSSLQTSYCFDYFLSSYRFFWNSCRIQEPFSLYMPVSDKHIFDAICHAMQCLFHLWLCMNEMSEY